MGFWFTEEIGELGTLFGGPEQFRGIGIVIDTYDNDRTVPLWAKTEGKASLPFCAGQQWQPAL